MKINLKYLALLFALFSSCQSNNYIKINGETPCATRTCWGNGGRLKCGCEKVQAGACFCPPKDYR